MLTVTDLSLDIGHKPLFNRVSFTLRRGQKVGLVGRNGQGKSTLLKVLCGETEYSAGSLNKAKGFRVGYLPQEVVTPERADSRLYEEAERAFGHLLEKKRTLDDIVRELEQTDVSSPEYASLLARHDRLADELHRQGFYSMRSRIEKVLHGLGFTGSDLQRPLSAFSGGWIMRLELAKLLLSDPDLILLDEPTNHLDLPSLSWLEDFLAGSQAGCLIVSHDRAFLDRVVSEIWELSNGRLTVFKGDYTAYERERKRRLELQEAAWRNQQKKLDEMKGFIQRFRAKATKARQVQSRMRQLEKMELVEAPVREEACSFRLPAPARAGKTVLEAKGLSKSFGGRPLFHDLSFQLERGQKMAIVGPNGAGKSTLVKILAGRLAPDGGQVRMGHNVTAAYFAQHQSMELVQDATILDNLRSSCPGLSETELRTIAGIFMFRQDDVFKKVSVLSGGEKSRVALAAVMGSGANLLLLDEPTNHLDMDAQKAVRDALSQYEGSVIVVSHNRYFLDGFVDTVMEIDAGAVRIFPGNLSQFTSMKDVYGTADREGGRCSMDAESEGPSARQGAGRRQRALSRKEKKRAIAELRQEKSRRLAPVRDEAARLEARIEELENEMKQIELLMADAATYTDQAKAAGLNRRYRQIRSELEGLYTEWEEKGERLEELEREFDSRIKEAEAL